MQKSSTNLQTSEVAVEARMERCKRSVSWGSEDLGDRRGAEAALAQRERYLAVLVEVQQTLLSLRDDRTSYEKLLKLLGQTVRASRVYLCAPLKDKSDPCSLCLQWHDVALKRRKTQLPTYCPNPRWIELLAQDTAIEGPVEELPPLERSLLQTQGVEFLLVLPLLVQGKLWGVLGFDQCRKSSGWGFAEVNLLTAAATAIALHQERHQAELALRQLQRPLQPAHPSAPESEVALSKSDFLATMSHELRTPLNAILGFTQLLTQETHLTAEQHSYVSTIDRNGQHLLRLVNNALEMAKLEAGSVIVTETTCDLHRFLKQIEATFRPQALDKHLSFSVECGPGVPQFIVIDADKLHQILAHLLDNAIKFTQTGGVWVRVSRGAGPIAASPALRFEVEDSGCGLATENLTHLLQPSGREPRSSSGIGLGLVISRRVAHLLGGELSVRSSPVHGSTFVFEVKEVKVESRSIASSSVPQFSGRQPPNYTGRRVLVMDECSENRQMLRQMLTPLGIEVREARPCQTDQQIWQDWKPDGIWIDLEMLLTHAPTAHLPFSTNSQQRPVIIAMTSDPAAIDSTVLRAIGCDDIVPTPLKEAIVLDKLAKHFGVSYTYENCVPPPVADPSYPDLSVMPEQWLTQLCQAASGCYDQQVFELIKQIPQAHRSLAAALFHLAYNFQFEEILNLAQRVPHARFH